MRPTVYTWGTLTQAGGGGGGADKVEGGGSGGWGWWTGSIVSAWDS